MKTIFVINPAAGSNLDTDGLKKRINDLASSEDMDISYYETTAVGDAERFARDTLEASPDEEFHLIACGGDGTFNEVLNGCKGSRNGSCSLVPMGTGNDFVRNFPESYDFNDLKALVHGKIIRCDAIEYSGVVDGEFRIRYCANMINIGFDCNAVDAAGRMKQKPLVSGSFAYLLGVGSVLIRKEGADLTVTADGKELSDGPILLTSIANGSYCGGGVMSNPYADLQDGEIDISVVKNISRRKFIKLFPKYQKGVHLDTPGVEDIITNLKAQEVSVVPRQGTMRISVDGELYTTEGLLFRAQPEAFRLIVPQALAASRSDSDL